MPHPSHQLVQNLIRAELDATFSKLDQWFDRPLELLHFRPDNGWTIAQVLEHVHLTNHFLLLTLNKQATRAVERANRGETIPQEPSDLEALNVIGIRGSFSWERPEHMEPTGDVSLSEIRQRLCEQKESCLQLLERLDNGVGRLVEVTMSVNQLGKIDLNQWAYFLVQHARRHLDQLAEIENSANQNGIS